MGAIIIKADRKTIEILSELAWNLEGEVLNITNTQFEDFALGSQMDLVKTGKNVSRKKIMKKLQAKVDCTGKRNLETLQPTLLINSLTLRYGYY